MKITSTTPYIFSMNPLTLVIPYHWKLNHTLLEALHYRAEIHNPFKFQKYFRPSAIDIINHNRIFILLSADTRLTSNYTIRPKNSYYILRTLQTTEHCYT